jgi:ABC-type transport system involved in multi-copper enzyme maturation permease subunit
MSDGIGWKNPVLGRELLDRLRSPKTVLTILAIAVGTCLLVQLRWPSDSRLDVVSQSSMEVFRPLAYVLTLAVMFLVPAFPATSLVNERRKGTLALLLNSPLRPWQIYVGKWLSNVILAMIMISASMPALSACYAMGGITFRSHIGPLLLVLLAMAIQYSAVGLWVSVRSHSTDASLRMTYVAVLILSVLSVGPLAIVGNLSGSVGWLANACTALSPLSALQEITQSQSQVADLGLSRGWLDFLVATSLVTVLFGTLTMLKLDPILMDRVKPIGKVTPKGTAYSVLRRIAFLIDPNQRKAGIPLWINPVMVKEFRTRKFGRLHWLLRIVACCIIVSLALTVVSATGTVSWGVQRIAAAMVLLQVGMLMLLGPSLGASLIAGEVESGGWQILRTTPIGPIRILTGKLWSVVWTMLILLLATLPGYIVMGYIVPVMVGQVNNVLISLLFVALFVIATSACVSGFARSAAVATITSYTILIAFFAGTLMIWMARGKPFGPIFVERALMLNPAAAALAEIQAPGFENYQLTPWSWWVSGTISVLCLLVLAIRTWLLSRPD